MTQPLRVAFTAAGAPQAATLIRHLRHNGDRPVHLIALDMNPDVVGRYMADSFRQIPQAGAPGYREAVIAVLEEEGADALLNCSENDVFHISSFKADLEARGIGVVCAGHEAVRVISNKRLLYERLREVPGVRVPEFVVVRTLDEFVSAARDMGYPQRDLCFKPPVSKGSRGFRILTERFDRRDLLLNQKPTARYMPLDDFRSIFEGHEDFPELLLMEVVTGPEYDIMSLAHEGEALLTSVKTRESHRWGVIDRGELVEMPELREQCARIVEALDLEANVYLQIIGDKVLEMGPRTSTYIFAPGFVEPWISVRLAVGDISPDEVRAFQDRIPVGRRMIRYMDQIFYEPDGSWSP